jgi:hypothetical protein
MCTLWSKYQCAGVRSVTQVNFPECQCILDLEIIFMQLFLFTRMTYNM